MHLERGMIKDTVHIQNGILISHKKNEIMPSGARWTDLDVIILSKSEEDNNISYRLYAESKKKNMIQMNLTNIELMVTKGGKMGRGIDWEFEIDIYTVLFKIDNQQEPSI